MSRGKGRQTGRFSTPSLIEPLETRRLLSSENLDLAFGSQGATIADFGPYTLSRASLVDSDGNILVAGSQGSNAFLARFDANGNLDPSFGNQGITKLDLGRTKSSINWRRSAATSSSRATPAPPAGSAAFWRATRARASSKRASAMETVSVCFPAGKPSRR